MRLSFFHCLAIALVVPFLAPMASADVLVAQTFAGKVVRMDELTGVQVPNWEIDASSLGGLLSGLTVSDAGVVYVTSGFTGSILHFDLATGAPIGTGLFAQLPDNPPLVSGGDPESAEPGAIKIGPDGMLYVADRGGTRIHRYNPSSGALLDSPVTSLEGVGAIGFANNGVLLSTNFDWEPGQPTQTPDKHAVYLGVGNPPSKYVYEDESTLFGPSNMLVNDDNSFLVVDLFGNDVVTFDPNGVYAGEFELAFPPDVDPDGDLPPGNSGANNFGSDLLRTPEGDILVSTLGISSVFQGASKNYGALLRYDSQGNLIEQLANDQSPVGAMALVPGLSVLPGDYDRDTDVDAVDYALWRSSYGRQVTPFSSADGNGDGVIDAADYTVWRDNVPGVVEMSASAAPEPAAMLLLLGGLLGGALVRKR